MKKRIEDLTGRRFGRLVVREFYDIDKYHRSRWLCECDCGNSKIVPRAALMNGNTSSCGCKSREIDDLTGMRFGKLTVIRHDHTDTKGLTYWLCECDCPEHNRVIVSRKHLNDGGTKSCGCLRHDDLTGMQFGFLTVLYLDHISKGRAQWRCRCERCGGEAIVSTTSLKNGSAKSCGCYKREQLGERTRTHGLTNHPLYIIWCGMKERCSDENGVSWSYYGEKGISVCDEWKHSFQSFYDWAMENGWECGLTIDRINNDYGYSPWNCQWVNKIAQANNRSNNRLISYAGEVRTIAQWAMLFDINYFTLRAQINRGDMRDFENYFGFADPNYSVYFKKEGQQY